MFLRQKFGNWTVVGIVGALIIAPMLLAHDAFAEHIPAPGNFGDAQRWYDKAAASGDRDAQFLLAQILESGKRGKPDIPTAIKWYRAAAAQGHLEAQLHLADLFDAGDIVKADHAEAAKWYGDAARAGSVRAQYNLGLMLQRGRGIEADTAKAAVWFRRAANGGLNAAQVSLSLLYAQGKGVKRDPVRALMWMDIASATGLVIPKEARDAIAGPLTPDQIASAKRQTKEWLDLRLRRKPTGNGK